MQEIPEGVAATVNAIHAELRCGLRTRKLAEVW
jgi:hypothetical protein